MRRFWIDGCPGMILVAMALSVIGCEAQEQKSLIASRNFTTDASDTTRSKSPATPATGEESTKTATDGRKIIYNARIDLVTEDLNLVESSLTKLISTQKAYVADSDRTGSAGSTRHGTWKVRVPVDRYDAFVKGAVALGELVSMKADSQDVSEEYFDLEARQVAKKVEEDRLLKHLVDSTGKLEEILAVERELSRVRSEIERMQGRLRALANLTSLATVTVSVSEIKGYVPPQSPTLGTRLGRTFAASFETLRQFGEGLLIVLVAIVPWLPILALMAFIIFWRTRRAAARGPLPVGIDPFPPPPPGR